MKKYSKYLLAAMCVVALAFSAGAFIKVNAASATVAPGQPVDLTYAAEKSLPSVVHILCTRNSKVETVEVQSNPFDDFFGDPFGFFGNPNQGNGGKQKRQYRTPKQQFLPSIFMSARSVVLSVPIIRAEYSLLSLSVTVSSSAPSTTWLLVTM